MQNRGGSRIFIGGGGGGASAEPNSLSAGIQELLWRSGVQVKGPGSSRVVLMLSRAIWALFLSILIKNLIKNPTVDPILGAGGPPLELED